MLTCLIPASAAAFRRGANQMRQQLSIKEQFWRGNAPGGLRCVIISINILQQVRWMSYLIKRNKLRNVFANGTLKDPIRYDNFGEFSVQLIMLINNGNYYS